MGRHSKVHWGNVIAMPYFLVIGRTIVEIWLFNCFQYGVRLPSLIFNIQVFDDRYVERASLHHLAKLWDDLSNHC